MVEDVLEVLRNRYTRVQCRRMEDGVSFVYVLLQYMANPLVVHRDLDAVFPLALLRKHRHRVRILIENESPFSRVLEHLGSFDSLVLVDYRLNNFENEFLRQACRINRKTVLMFSEMPSEYTLGREGGHYTFLGRDLMVDGCAMRRSVL